MSDQTLIERTLLLAALNTLGEISEDTEDTSAPGYFSVKIGDLEGWLGRKWDELEVIFQKADSDAAKMKFEHESGRGPTDGYSAFLRSTTDREAMLSLAELDLESLDEVDWNGDPLDFERAHQKLVSVLKRIVRVLRGA